jgi:hypothetical protein
MARFVNFSIKKVGGGVEWIQSKSELIANTASSGSRQYRTRLLTYELKFLNLSRELEPVLEF